MKLANDGFLLFVSKGKVPTNSVPLVEEVFSDFNLAADTYIAVSATGGTNKLTTAEIIIKGEAVISAVLQAEINK